MSVKVRASTDRYLSPRAMALHVALLVVIGMCAVATRWQIDRALSGNSLSWLYVFEWPAFSGIAVWMWWVLLVTRPVAAEPAARLVPPRWDPDEESDPLRVYNSYLAELNAGGWVTRPARPAKKARRQ